VSHARITRSYRGRGAQKLKELAEILVGESFAGDVAHTRISGVAYRSDSVEPGDVFFCIKGFRHDGHEFASDAVQRGASALVLEHSIPGLEVPQVVVPDSRVALADAADRFYDSPSSRLELVGITGTNGKTTTTYLCDSVLRASGRRTGLIGTVETRIAEERIDSSRTTPESADLQALFARMVEQRLDAVSMEVSSHAIDLHRVDAAHFSVAAFTNLTQDHLDYHQTIEEYFAVKRRLFTDFDVATRVINIDDTLGAGMAAELDGVLTVGMAAEADIRATDVRLRASSSEFRLHTPLGVAPVRLPLAALYNVSNALVAVGCAIALGIDLQTIVHGLEMAPQVPGRLERIDTDLGFNVFVDYAHTPDSLEKALTAVRDATPGRVIAVFGAGGDRDPEKRALMGRAAALVADHIVVTTDNPRSEDPVGIILQIEDGLREGPASYQVEIDRQAAIAAAIGQASEGDAVLIAGKGHEDYQIFADRTIHFDDREVAREEIAKQC